MPNRSTFFIATTAIMILALFSLFGWNWYVKYKMTSGRNYYDEIKIKTKIYCYDTLSGTLNPAFYIDDLKYKDELITYYDSIQKDAILPISFPINFMPYSKQLILLRYVYADSSIAEVVDFNTKCWGYMQGYVTKKTLHNAPPSNELLRKKSEFWQKIEESPQYQRTQQIIRHRNPYGIHCD